jgi:preprotein translocase subunit Sec63
VTSILQKVYYGITITAGEPWPQPSSPRFERHRRRIHIFVVTSYLLYTLYEAFYDVRRAGDFYGALGVSPLADEKTIKSRFRRLAAQHHPDKLQQASNGDGFGSPGSDSFFVYLKRAQDTLLDPARRYAYDRFGPDVAERREGQTMQDFIFTAMYKLAPEYLGGLALIILLNFTWWSQWGRFVGNRFFSLSLFFALK